MHRLFRDTIFHHNPAPSFWGPWRAERVAMDGMLDLDDVRAEVAQDLAAEGSGEHRRDVQHPEARQGAGGWVDRHVYII